MRQERILVALILAEFVLVILGVVCDPGAIVRPSSALLSALWVAVVVGTVLAWIGLLNLVRAARPLYVTSWAAYFLLILLSGPVESTALGYVVQMLMALVGWAVIGVIYVSDLRTRFRTLAEALGVTRSAAPRSD
jgi:hypothetical protein